MRGARKHVAVPNPREYSGWGWAVYRQGRCVATGLATRAKARAVAKMLDEAEAKRKEGK